MDRSPLPVIITRAEPGAAETAARVVEMGERPVLSPVLSIETKAEVALPDLASCAGLVFTSANGVRAFAERASDRTHTAWCVGPATAAAARDADFTTIQESAGNAVDLAHYIAARAQPSEAPLLHIANAAAKGDLKATLETRGFAVRFAPLYAMRPAAHLSEGALTAIQSGAPAALLVHSAKGAAQSAKLTEALDLSALALVGISETAITPLASRSFKTVQVAQAPNEDGLFAALADAIATLSA